jgi:transcriptional regulator with XRE-family HTH domain
MNRFKEARIKLGMGQKEVAAAMGVTQPTVSAWEADAKTPAADNLSKLSDLYGVSVDYLLGKSDNPARRGRIQYSNADDDAEFWELRDQLHKRPEMKILFDASRKASKEDIETVAKLMNRLTNKDE